MKIQIEISEESLRDIAQRQVAQSMQTLNKDWFSPEYVRDQVKAAWSSAVVDAIREQLADNEGVKKLVRDAMEKKIKSQMAALIKETLV